MKRLNLVVLVAVCLSLIAVPAATAQATCATVNGNVTVDLTGTIYNATATIQFVAMDLPSGDSGLLIYTEDDGEYYVLNLTRVDQLAPSFYVLGGTVTSGSPTNRNIRTHWNFWNGKYVEMSVTDGTPRGRPDKIAPNLPEVIPTSGNITINYGACPVF